MKKAGILLSSSVLSFGMFSTIANASNTVNEQPEKVQIQVASTEIGVTKNDLIKKFRKLFPNQFGYLKDSDFQMSNGHFYLDDETLRHDLSFTKTVNGKRLYGSVGFVGKDLDIEQFYYQPTNEAEALFPAKVSKEEARKKAVNFIKQFLDGEEYQLETDSFNYYSQQPLTEPVRYSFSFTRMENKVPVSDQRIEVTILGNGELVNFYRYPMKNEKSTFEDVKLLKDKKKIEENVKGNLSADLYYQINTDYRTGERGVQLVYQPTVNLQGVHATSGKWLTTNGYTTDFPKGTKIEMISDKPLPAKQNGVSLEEAKKIAEQLLTSKSDKVKLNIESIQEVENYNGQTVFRINYMYQFANGGTGTALEINKRTGEVTQFYDLTSQIQEQIGEQPKKENAISQQKALTQAIQYLKEWVPSYLHNYAMPIATPYFDKELGAFSISFPRVVNGITVIGDDITVSIAADGSLSSLNVSYQEVEKWPSSDKIISKEAAKNILKESLNLKLTYKKQEQNGANHGYDLVYVPIFSEESLNFLDANTGEWKSFLNRKNSTVISHPWAQEELNYLIQANILDVKDSKKFDGNASVSKGEALKVIINSLTYFYEGNHEVDQENMNQTFKNIDVKHPFYQVIERAVELRIIQPNDKGFDVDGPVTREELAAWYIRILGLEQAAKDASIYKLDFADAKKVNKEYSGYVALANSVGLLKVNQNSFHPKQQVTYAELAVSTIRLAHKMSESGKYLQY
ncbi:S-layer homology domain-containing protein [Sporosarcina sp. NPDC096371]|uniref:S-layer homology domain-containing protein n=1 Tax=Sporosarcina sp. NPDC096371 TaxID=3364530 RepID=UPI0038220531